MSGPFVWLFRSDPEDMAEKWGVGAEGCPE